MKETYILRLFVDSKLTSVAQSQSEDQIKESLHDADISMFKQGYKRVSYLKTRVDKKHVTSITVTYTKV